MAKLYKRPNSPYWWYWIWSNGKLIRKSTKQLNKRNARKVMERAQLTLELNKHRPNGNDALKTKYEDLRDLIITNYTIKERKSIHSLRLKLKPLNVFFEGMLAVEINANKVDKYIVERKKNVKNATINRELSILIRMLNLGMERDMVYHVPKIEKLPEKNVRIGFLNHDEYMVIHKALLEHVRPIVAIAYKLGMRKGEILSLTWDRVDMVDGIIHLDNTKTDEPRTLPLDVELQRDFRLLYQRNKNCPYVFVNARGDGRVKDFYYSWRKAVLHASEYLSRPHLKGLLFHDLRRTAVRNLIRAGVPRKIAMMITGHKTESTFNRYHIVAPEDLEEAIRLQGEFIKKIHQKLMDRVWTT